MLLNNKNFTMPRTLWIADLKNVLVRKQFLRHLPGKREVWLADCGERQVIAKIFYQYRNALRELNGLYLLQEAELPTVALIQHGWVTNKKGYAIVMEEVTNAMDLATLWPTLSEERREKFLHDLVKLFARLHQAGLTHTDPHFKNFLVKNNRLIFLDAGAIAAHKAKQPLALAASLKNLGFLLAQLAPEFDSLVKNAFLLYMQERNLPFTLAGVANLQKCVSAMRCKRIMAYSQKVFRSTSALQKQHSWNQLVVWERKYSSDAFMQMLDHPEEIMQNANNIILKAGNSCTVAQITVDGRQLVIKRYNIKNFWHGLKKCWRTSRAALAWRNAHRLQLVNIPTTKPVAFIEKRFGPLRFTTYFIYEYIAGAKLIDYFSSRHSQQDNKQIATATMNLLSNLQRIRISHGDLKATNILVNENKQPVLLDLDATRLHSRQMCWKKARQKDEQRFQKNWENKPEIARLFAGNE